MPVHATNCRTKTGWHTLRAPDFQGDASAPLLAYPEPHGKRRRDLNAYTGKEETIYYTAFLKEHFARAVDLLADIVLGSTYPQTEMNKEVEVVIDEIESYNDSPSELIFDDFENLIFAATLWDVTSWAKPDVCGDSAARTSNVSPGGCTVPTGWFSSSTDASNRHMPAGEITKALKRVASLLARRPSFPDAPPNRRFPCPA